MLNLSNQNYVKVFKLDKKERYAQGLVSSSKKDKKTGEYVNSSFSTRFVGKAFEKIDTIEERDTIIITSAAIENVFSKEKKVSYLNLIIFDFDKKEVTAF